MIVVSNTSPLTNLAAIGQFSVLHDLFGRVEIPLAVVHELSAHGKQWPGAEETASAEWITKHTIGNQPLVDALRLDLDFGEAEAIALALQLKADLLLDEQTARYVAQHFDLRVMGVVGLLIRAKTKGFLPQVRPHLDSLRQQAGFYLSEVVYRDALELAGE